MAKRKPRSRVGRTSSHTHRVAKTYINRQLWRIVEMPLQQVLPALMPNEGWYVARVTPGREQKVEDTLSESGMAVFVPRFRKSMKRQKEARELRPTLIPGYVFVGFDGRAAGDAKVRALEEVIDLLSYWDEPQGELRPVRIPEAVMTRFVREVSDNAKAMPLEFVLQRGDRARITEGPFAGFLTWVERVDKGFVDGLVDMMGCKRSVTIPVDSLEPVVA